MMTEPSSPLPTASPASSSQTGTRLAVCLMIASGFASLGYQIVWTQQCAAWLGHETAGVLAVVAAFFGGLALGAGLLGARVERSLRPARWYAACELLIAAWSCVLALLMDPLGSALLALAGPQPSAFWHWLVAFAGSFVLLLPATAAMGATLPAMNCTLEAMRKQRDAHNNPLALLYASNTFGAVAGVLAAAFWLVPQLGLLRTAGLCAIINLLCAAMAWRLRVEQVPSIGTTQHDDPAHLRRLMITGFLGIGFEVLVVRVLSQVTEDTVYTFAMLLAVYLAGTSLGAAAYEHKLTQRWLARNSSVDARARLLCGLALACLLGTVLLWPAALIKHWLLVQLGSSLSAALLAEAVLALLAFGIPTFAMGAAFCHLAREAQTAGISLGRALAFNTLGAAFAPCVFGVLLVPALGLKFALLLLVPAYLLLALPASWKRPAMLIPAAGFAVLAIFASPLAFVDVPEGGHIVHYRDGAMASVSVVADAQDVLRLRIDNRQQEGSTDSVVADSRQALLPLLLHSGPKRVLFLGLGTGVTASAAAANRNLQVDVAELLPEVIASASDFAEALDKQTDLKHLHIIHADARRYVRATDQQYEVIIADNFHPARSGSAALYTVEHFRAVRARLSTDGIFCQWLPLHQLDLDTLRAVVRSFTEVFPDAHAILATNSLDTPVIGLLGTPFPVRFDPAQVRARLSTPGWPQPMQDFALPDEFAVIGSFIASPQSLTKFAQGAHANTDDQPVVAYLAPRITYAPDSQARDRLMALLGELSLMPAEILSTHSDATTQQRYAAYWSARNLYLDTGRKVQASQDVVRMLAQVRTPLLEVLHTSPDFRPAYDPLLAMAGALAHQDRAGARALLEALGQLQPARKEAGQMLSELSAN